MEREKLIEVLKSRTVANGCTLEEEMEAKRKLEKLTGEVPKQQTCLTSGYASHATFGSYVNDIIRKNQEEVVNHYTHTDAKMKEKQHLRCPHCGHIDWYKGNQVAGSMNILCATCFREYNYSMGNLFENGDWEPVDLDTLDWYGIKYPQVVEEDNPVGFNGVWNSSSLWQKIKYKFKKLFNLW